MLICIVSEPLCGDEHVIALWNQSADLPSEWLLFDNEHDVARHRAPNRDNGNVHRAAAKDMQAEKAARPAAPCATYCYHAVLQLGQVSNSSLCLK